MNEPQSAQRPVAAPAYPAGLLVAEPSQGKPLMKMIKQMIKLPRRRTMVKRRKKKVTYY